MELKLNRNLRRVILQGNPWVYREALEHPPSEFGLAKLSCQKNQFVAWGFSDPRGPLSFRALSLNKAKPQQSLVHSRLVEAQERRNSFGLIGTDCYRLANGEGDGLPGLVCDIYSDLAVIQLDGSGPEHFYDLDHLNQIINSEKIASRVYFKPRTGSSREPRYWEGPAEKPLPEAQEVKVQENDLDYFVNFVAGQKTGFFLDQRENRNYVAGLRLKGRGLNLYSYTGAFSLALWKAGIEEVTSVDLAQPALEAAQKNGEANGLPLESHHLVKADVQEYLNSKPEGFSAVICDPPSMARSEKQKPGAINAYIEAFSGAAKAVLSGGDLFLSSCSGHISFQDFEEIVRSSLQKARVRGQVLRVSGQGPDHPYPMACPELRYLKFMHLVISR